METSKLSVLILAAGVGARMNSRRPKVMHELAGLPMIRYVLDTAEKLSPEQIVVVIGPDMPEVASVVAPHMTVIQEERLGTGHAVMAACNDISGAEGDVIILFGDTPRIQLNTLQTMLMKRRNGSTPAVVVLGMNPDDPGQYGRLITDHGGGLRAIIEYQDADPDEREIGLVNSGVIAVDRLLLKEFLSDLTNENSKGEYYLTGIIAAARARGHGASYVEGSPDELVGVNSRSELARVENQVQMELRERSMANGVTLTVPETVHFSADTILGSDVIIEPYVVFGPGVRVENNVTIRSFSHLEGSHILDGAIVGPFARLRAGSNIGEGARIGNFVEIKNATLGEGVKANHLTYLGDAHVGAHSNIGAGTITCNYDGFEKWPTEVGAGAFIGSNTSLVAPVKIGKDAVTGAGSVISSDVPEDALGVTRSEQKTIHHWAARKRNRKSNSDLKE
tara:strand:+ start:908 stop:2257 length:1350 start_codon:yes stop_codon:yes gene_type:complete